MFVQISNKIKHYKNWIIAVKHSTCSKVINNDGPFGDHLRYFVNLQPY